MKVIQVSELMTRAVAVKNVDLEARTITGLAVPYGQDTSVGEYKERFERGAVQSIDGVKLFSEHREPIGLVTKGEDTDEGFLIEARISETTKGNEVYTLLKDGVLDRFSVGFLPVEEREEDGVVVRTAVNLKEVSVVCFPAYDGASISHVRNNVEEKGNTNNTKEDINIMSTENYASSDDVAVVRDAVEDLERRVANFGNVETASAPQFRSAGEFIKALADGDETAKNEIRAFTGANGSTLSDSHAYNDWKGVLLDIVNAGRPVVNLFSKGPLGASGNTVEFAKVSTLTGDVAQQANEADNLAFLEVGITTGTAPVKTYGGYSELSRQVIERSDVSYLDTVLRFQAASYAKVTNAAVRAALVAATPQTGAGTFSLAAATGKNFLAAAVDGVQKVNDNGAGAQADFILVSADVYAVLATLVDSSNRPLFNINGDGANTVGNINVRGIAGSLAGLPVVVDTGLAVRTMYVASSTAVTTWENAGAPIRLQSENVINLTKAFSLYGYLAVGAVNPNGLVKVTMTA